MRLRPVDGPFALSHRSGNADHIHCLNAAAQARGLYRGMPMADARALCPGLTTRPADLAIEAAFHAALVRWAGRYSPFVARDGSEGVVADITGVAHLFGGEQGLFDDLRARMARHGLTFGAAIADTRGAAWAMARHGGGIAPAGQTAAAIARLPVTALRIDGTTADGLSHLGLRHIGELAVQPRAPLARRFGTGLLLRLDQALGLQPEPVSPAADSPHFGVRLTLPEPIGLIDDVMAGLRRLLDRLCDRLDERQQGARRLRLTLRRVDGGAAVTEIGLARPMRDPAAMATLFARAVAEVDAGYGIDQLRLTAPLTEPLRPTQMLQARQGHSEDKLTDLVTRLGNRLGFAAIERYLPAESHIPERSFLTVAAAYSPPSQAKWPRSPDRPLAIFPPEPLFGLNDADSSPPARFRWRGMWLVTAQATGPERIAPEWWFDDPLWRSGLRDYWKIATREGRRLWLFHTPQTPGWAVQGEFA